MVPVKTVAEMKPPSRAGRKQTGSSFPVSGRAIRQGISLINSRISWKHPLNLVHAVTTRCNAKCGFCAWKFHEGADDELTTEEIHALYESARKEGFHWLVLWGGEPLLRRDIGDIARRAHEIGFSTTIVTNGFLLSRRMHEVAPFMNRINISLDHPSEKHDEMRGLPGLYEKIIEATKEAKRKYPKIPIFYTYTMHRDNCDQKSIKEMAVLVHQMDVAVIFNPLRVEAASEGQDNLNLEAWNASSEQLSEAFALIGRLKSTGYPIIDSYTYIDTIKKGMPVYRCHWPKINLPMESNGDIVDCMNWGIKPVTNIRNSEFSEILKHPRLHELAGSCGENCHKCISHHRMEISEIYEGNGEPLRSWAGAMAPQMLRLPGRR